MTTSDHHHHAQIHNTRVQIQSEGHRKVSRYAAVSVLIVSVVMLFVFTEWRQPTTQGSQPSAMGEALILLPPQAPPHQQATATVVGWDVPLFLHDSFAGVAIDPSYGAELDIACNNVLPAHGTCLQNTTTTNPSPSSSSSCLVRYHRAAHLACRANHSDLCPCHQKRIAVVHNVHFIGALKDRMIQHKQFFAVSPQRANDRTVAAFTWALIDATTPETNGLGCMFGEAWALAKMNTSLPMIGNLSAEISRLQERQTKVSTNDPFTTSSTKGGGTAAYGSCEWLRDSPRATPPNRSTTVDDSVPIEGQEVFYALESGVTFPGHALSVLVAAIGQYVAEGLDKRGIPWLVPCLSSTQGARVAATSGGSRGSRSRRNTTSVPIWTTFFLQLNEALQFPLLPFNMELDITAPTPSPIEYPTTTSHHTNVLRLSKVHFVNYNAERNQVCVKPVLRQRLWPTIVQLAAARQWDESLRSSALDNGQFDDCSSSPTLSSSSQPRRPPPPEGEASTGDGTNLTVVSLPPQYLRVKRFAFMKVVGARGSVGSASSPDRSFLYSRRFSSLLCEKGIIEASPTLPLLERMWHVNTAELIVTTWGSAMATVTNLLMPRRRHHCHHCHYRNVGPNHSSSNATYLDDAETQRTPPQHRQQRILVLVHPSYCHEVFVLNMPYKQCFKLTRSPAKTFAQTISIVRRRAPTDFLGGPDFCIKYLLVSSLRYVVDRDLSFSCPRRRLRA